MSPSIPLSLPLPLSPSLPPERAPLIQNPLCPLVGAGSRSFFCGGQVSSLAVSETAPRPLFCGVDLVGVVAPRSKVDVVFCFRLLGVSVRPYSLTGPESSDTLGPFRDLYC